VTAPRRFPPPWTVDETDACFIVKDHTGHSLAYAYFEEERGRASGAAWFSGGLDPASTECVGVVLSSNARAKTQARLMRKARVRADSTRVRSTNETSFVHPDQERDTSSL
jgi:hypothetical protein